MPVSVPYSCRTQHRLAAPGEAVEPQKGLAVCEPSREGGAFDEPESGTGVPLLVGKPIVFTAYIWSFQPLIDGRRDLVSSDQI